MKLKRVTRDVVVLLLFAALFYVSSVVVGQWEDGQSDEPKEFSEARLRADDRLHEKSWSAAADSYHKITLADPFNGYAWYRIGYSYNEMRQEVKSEIKAAEENELTSQQIAELEGKLAELNRKAVAGFEKSREHLRYRANSLFLLSIIHADAGEYETSLDYLEEIVDRKYVFYYQLDHPNYHFFGTSRNGERTRLHQFGRFWEINKKHDKVKAERSRRRF